MIILEKDSVLFQWLFPMIWLFFTTLTADGSYISNLETQLGIESVRVLRVLLRFCSTLPLSPGLEGFKVEDRADPPPQALKKAWSIATWKANDEKNSSKQAKTQLARYSKSYTLVLVISKFVLLLAQEAGGRSHQMCRKTSFILSNTQFLRPTRQ